MSAQIDSAQTDADNLQTYIDSLQTDAEQGNDTTQYALAFIYRYRNYGEETPEDMEQALYCAKSGIHNPLVPVAAIYFLTIILSCLSVVIQVVACSKTCPFGLDSISGMGGSRCPEFAV